MSDKPTPGGASTFGELMAEGGAEGDDLIGANVD